MAAMLIAAVGVALKSVNHAVGQRLDEYVGRADLRVRAAGKDGAIDAALADVIAGWPEAAVVSPRLTAAASLRFVAPRWSIGDGAGTTGAWTRKPEIFVASGKFIGVPADPAKHVRPIRLERGRLPIADGEVVLDRSFVKRLGGGKKEPAGGPEGFDAGGGLGSLKLGDVGLAMFAKGKAGGKEIMKAQPGPEVAADAKQAEALNAAAEIEVGDSVEVVWFQREPVRLTVVGIAPSPPLGGTPQAWMTVDGLAKVTEKVGELTEIDIVVRGGIEPASVVAKYAASMPKGAMLQTTELVTSGLNKNLRANRLGFWIISILTFGCGAFIIMTGMSTGVTERQRELGILRSIGAFRGQLAWAQVLHGVMIGGMGGAVGVPLGVAAAWIALLRFAADLGVEPVLSWFRVVWPFAGAVGCGVLGALWPAWQASRTSPLRAMAVRSEAPKRRTLRRVAIVGLVGVVAHLVLILTMTSPEAMMISYFAVGMPGLMIGYFLLGVPATLLVVRVLGGAIEAVLALPRGMLRRTIEATPYRFGFTSSAMMTGLALMVAIWTQGGAVMRDWIDQIKFPDAFVAGLAMDARSLKLIEELPFVTGTSTVAIQPVESTDAFGVGRMSAFKTNFVAFEPDSFFRMTKLTWVQGDPATAQRRLNEGGAVIVAREFLTAKGKGVGDRFVCTHNGQEISFEIVGVVASPGLEMIGNFFDAGDGFVDQSMHAVFGSRKDLKDKFGSEAVQMIQVSLDPNVSDDVAIPAMRAKVISSGALAVGSGRQIKAQIMGFVGTALLITSGVGVFAMFVACFGVANLIIAGVQARQFEFGVLRAVGASKGMLARLVLGEAVVIAATASVLGTMMGVQGALGGNRIDRLLWGMDVTPTPPVGPILAGCAVVFVMTCGAAVPAVVGLSRKRVRELLGAVRG